MEVTPALAVPNDTQLVLQRQDCLQGPGRRSITLQLPSVECPAYTDEDRESDRLPQSEPCFGMGTLMNHFIGIDTLRLEKSTRRSGTEECMQAPTTSYDIRSLLSYPSIALPTLGVFLLLFLIPITKLLRRTGHSAFWCLLALFPGLNVIAFWVFAFKRWPTVKSQREVYARQKET